MSAQERAVKLRGPNDLARVIWVASVEDGATVAPLLQEDADNLADAVLAAGWRPPGTDTSDAVREALYEALRAIEHARNEHWQARPTGPGGASLDKDYGKHDAYYDAARIVREVRDRRAPHTGQDES